MVDSNVSNVLSTAASCQPGHRPTALVRVAADDSGAGPIITRAKPLDDAINAISASLKISSHIGLVIAERNKLLLGFIEYEMCRQSQYPPMAEQYSCHRELTADISRTSWQAVLSPTLCCGYAPRD